MFFGVSKIVFTNRPSHKDDAKAAKALCEKLRAKLPVCAKACSAQEQAVPSIAITTLAHTEHDVEEILDKVLDICEQSDLGEIDAEYTLIEPVDILEEDDEEEVQ